MEYDYAQLPCFNATTPDGSHVAYQWLHPKQGKGVPPTRKPLCLGDFFMWIPKSYGSKEEEFYPSYYAHVCCNISAGTYVGFTYLIKVFQKVSDKHQNTLITVHGSPTFNGALLYFHGWMKEQGLT